jgi:hypothetical protein
MLYLISILLRISREFSSFSIALDNSELGVGGNVNCRLTPSHHGPQHCHISPWRCPLGASVSEGESGKRQKSSCFSPSSLRQTSSPPAWAPFAILPSIYVYRGHTTIHNSRGAPQTTRFISRSQSSSVARGCGQSQCPLQPKYSALDTDRKAKGSP